MTNITRIAAAAALTMASAGAAMAADLPARVAPPAPYIAPLPVFTWTGAYFGINLGGVFDNSSRFTTTGVTAANTGVTTGVRPGSAKVTDSGFTGGGQIGYNYQFGAGSGLVIGAEADAAWTDLDKTNTYVGINGANNTLRAGLDYLGTVRGRVGYAFNQFLIYGTGGFAYGGVNTRANFNNAANTMVLYSGSRSQTGTGFAYGGGIEYAIPANSFFNFFHSSAVTLKAEYLHYDLGSTTLAVNAVPGTPGVGGYSSRVKTDGNLARIGINYKF
jgi:outer membrane immunogenic protein